MALLPRRALVLALLLVATGDGAPIVGAGAAIGRAEWQPLRDAIDAFADVPDVLVQLGNATGPLFLHAKGDTTLDTSMPVASATKWLGNVMLMMLVEEGALGLDDRVGEHVEWWTSDPEDSRARITLRHCMAFTTGYVGQQSCGALETTEECARSVYANRAHVHPAGTFFDYNSDHTRIAAAMAEAASGESITALVQRLIFDRTAPPMVASSWSNPIRPDLAAALTTTPRDYEAFLSSYYRGELVSSDGRRVMETDQCPSCEACEFCQTRGHYALGNWAGCIGWGAADEGQWSTRCAVAGEFWSSVIFSVTVLPSNTLDLSCSERR
jgi:CubicO group peptidase (beta-lactamase class C family)